MGRKRIIIVVSLAAIAVIIGLVFVTPLPQGGATRTTDVGVVLPLTGGLVTTGIAMKNSLELALHEINKQEKWSEAPINLVYADGMCSFEGGAEAGRALAQQGIAVIINAGCSGETLGTASATEDAGTVLITPTSSSPAISNLGDRVFRVAASDILGGEVLAEEVHSRNFKNPAIIYEDTEYVTSLVDRFVGVYGGLGGQPVAIQLFEPDARDFEGNIRTIADAPSVDAIVIFTQGAATMRRLLQDLDDAEINDVQYFANEFADSDEVRSLGGIADGMLYAVPFLDETNPDTQEFLEQYQREYSSFSSLPPFYLATAYDTMHIVADAITPYSIDLESVTKHLSALQGYRGVSNKALYFDENGDANQRFIIKEL